MKFRLSVIGFFFVVAVLAVQLCAQLTGDTVTVPSFLKKEKNVIEFNDADWSVLFDGMVRLQNDTDTVPRVVAMVHIGDSHVQAGFLTEAVRLPLQRRFGDAGRGLVVPLKLAKTNEPRDYSVVADGSWNFSRCVGRKYSNYSFPGGISEPFLVEGETRLPFLTHFSWEESVCSVHLTGEAVSKETPLAIYGASLETGESGILYHTIGNNGAFYSSYAAIPGFSEQVAALSPSLIVLSLGTNESFSTSLTRDELYKQIDTVVSSLRKDCPQAQILLTTPAECARRRVRRVNKKRRVYYTPNARVKLVQETIRSYAVGHRLACWDWYEIAGGEGSSSQWRKAGFMAYDRTHCTETGYRVQGEMLYRALMKAYQEYVDRVAQ